VCQVGRNKPDKVEDKGLAHKIMMMDSQHEKNGLINHESPQQNLLLEYQSAELMLDNRNAIICGTQCKLNPENPTIYLHRTKHKIDVSFWS
jgi:hypothetical protein